jgi:6-phosphogluconolactonase
VGHQPTGGHWPRNFALGPAGRFLYVANQDSDDIVAFTIDTDSGLLSPTGFAAHVSRPACIQFALI